MSPSTREANTSLVLIDESQSDALCPKVLDGALQRFRRRQLCGDLISHSFSPHSGTDYIAATSTVRTLVVT